MKQSKRILCLLMAIVLCFSLTACNELDEMRATHAIKQEDGTILWNGYTYRALDGYYDTLNDNGLQTVYVTDPEVPLLFSRLEYHLHYASANGILLIGTEYAEDTVFCREDHYEWVKDAAENGFEPEAYGSYFISYDYAEVNYLSQAERETIDRILSVPSVPMDSNGEWMFCFSIYGFSQYDVLRLPIGSVMWTGQEYVFQREEGVFVYYYPVPESEWALLDELNGGRPAEFVPKVEEEPIYTTHSTVRTQVSTTKAPNP